jgi:hypothetical protein
VLTNKTYRHQIYFCKFYTEICVYASYIGYTLLQTVLHITFYIIKLLQLSFYLKCYGLPITLDRDSNKLIVLCFKIFIVFLKNGNFIFPKKKTFAVCIYAFNIVFYMPLYLSAFQVIQTFNRLFYITRK